MGLMNYGPDEPMPEAAKALRAAEELIDQEERGIKLLQIGKHYKTAIRQKKSIFEKYCTPEKRPGMENFTQ